MTTPVTTYLKNTAGKGVPAKGGREGGSRLVGEDNATL